jgi:hypothetical protein
LEVYTREDFPTHWADVHGNLGSLYASRVEGGHPEDAAQAEEHCRHALEILIHPTDQRRLYRVLGEMAFHLGRWQQAQTAFEAGITAGEARLGEAHTQAGRQEEVWHNVRFYPPLAYCLLKQGRFGDALARLDQGKTRLLNQALELVETDRGAMDILGLAAPGEALVMPVLTAKGTAVILIPHGVAALGDEHILWLDATAESLLHVLRGSVESGQLGGWMGAYLRHRDARSATTLEIWKDTIDALTGQLWDQLMGPIHARLESFGVKRVVLMPAGGLQLLPLHAAWREVDGKKRALIDDFAVSYAPSASVLKVCRQRAAARSGQKALVVGVDEYDALPPLDYAREEAEAVALALQSEPLINAARAEVLSRAPGSAYLHFSCHALYG